MTNTTTLNNVAVELIAAFSKANKVSKAKVTELAEQLVATMPVVVRTTRSGAGRKASENVLALRKMMEDQKEVVVNMTAKEVASKFGCDAQEVNNTLRFFEKTGMFAKVGFKDKEPGTRGKREIVWSFVSE